MNNAFFTVAAYAGPGCDLEVVRIHEGALAPYIASESGMQELEQIPTRQILI